MALSGLPMSCTIDGAQHNKLQIVSDFEKSSKHGSVVKHCMVELGQLLANQQQLSGSPCINSTIVDIGHVVGWMG